MTNSSSKENKEMLKIPPEEDINSLQLDLFSNFLENKKQDISNSAEYWECIPKYFITAVQQKKLRPADGLTYSQIYEYKGKS